MNNTNISGSFTFDSDLLDGIISELNEQLPDHTVNPDYYIDGTNLIITAGKDGVNVDSTTLKNNVINLLSDVSTTDYSITLPVVNTTAKVIDIETIYKDVYKEPVDAYYETNPYVVHPSSTGLEFNISLDEAKSLLQEEKEEYHNIQFFLDICLVLVLLLQVVTVVDLQILGYLLAKLMVKF